MTNVIPNQVQSKLNSALEIDAVTRARINDARAFRQRASSGSAELTLRLEHESINKLWGRSVAEALAATSSRSVKRAEELWTAAVQYSTNSQQLAYSCSHLAELYYQQKLFVKAESLCMKMVTLYRQGEDSISEADLATALHNTALLYQAMLRFDEAESLYLESVQIRTKHLKFDDPLMVTVVDDYKSCIRARNQHQNPWSRVSQFENHN